jgi:predicted sulfurtransferase
MAKKKRQGHYCWRCESYRDNEEFSGKGYAEHICKECSSEMKQHERERRKARRAKASQQEAESLGSDSARADG